MIYKKVYIHHLDIEIINNKFKNILLIIILIHINNIIINNIILIKKIYSLINYFIYLSVYLLLFLEKDRQEIQKKEIDRTIHLKDIIPKLTPQEIKKDIPKPSPSPSKITNPIHTNLVSPQSNNPSMPLTSPLNNKSGINNI